MKQSVISFVPAKNINVVSHRKESHYKGGYKIITFKNNEFEEIVDLKIYSTKATTFACVWVRNEYNIKASGSGKSTGYAYHRESHAIELALNSAGLKFKESISGRGKSSIETFLNAIARYFNLENFTIIESHP